MRLNMTSRWLTLAGWALLSTVHCTPDHAGGGPDATLRYRTDASADAQLADAIRADALPPGDAGPVPVAWSCLASFWGDGDCDCGCGALDLDCPDALASSCEFRFCSGSQVPVPDQNWLCTDPPDAGTPDGARPDTAIPDTATVDAGPPPLQRSETCTSPGPDRCATGLVCTPTGTCQELCAEQHCANNANFCFSSHPTMVCPGASHPYCVDGEGGLDLCRDINLDFTQTFCPTGSGSYVWYYHSNSYSLPEGCWDGPVEFTTAHICISGMTDTRLTRLGHDLTVITDDPDGYTDTSSCDYFSTIRLNGLQLIGGDLEVGDVASSLQRSDMQVQFTALEIPVLEAVYGQLRYQQAPYVAHINAPLLRLVGGFVVLDDLPAMETVYLPGLEVIEGGLRLHDLPALTTLELGALRRIDGYVSISNVPCVERSVLDAIAAKATGPVSLSNAGTGLNCD